MKLCERLPAYTGMIAARVAAEHEEREAAGGGLEDVEDLDDDAVMAGLDAASTPNTDGGEGII